MQVQEYLEAVARLYRERGFVNPVQNLRVKKVVKSMKIIETKEKKTEWLQDPFQLEVLRYYYDNPLKGTDPVIWCRDLILVALDFCMIQRPEVLYKLKIKNVEEISGLFWLRIRKAKNNPFVNRRFVLFEPTRSKICSVRLLGKYLKVKLFTPCNEPLFLLKKEEEMSVVLISLVVK
ncbi:26955_t:CDS:1, partial [Gigaspora margarita]